MCSASATLSAAPKASDPATPVTLPPSLRNAVAVLEAPNPTAPGGKTSVYLLAMSHVSKRSVEQVHELIHLVRPEVVAVELCKERSGLLVDPEDAATAPKVWHSRKIQIEGLPEDEASKGCWPSSEQLQALLTCRPGRPVNQQDIEGDVIRLLSTGLFASCRPGASNAGREEAPAFLVKPPAADAAATAAAAAAGPDLSLVPPLGAIRFRVTPRSLPALTGLSARVDSSLKSANVDQRALDAICLKATDECKAGASGLVALLRTRQRVKELLAGHEVTVSFTGVDSGRVEMIVKATKPTDPAYASGLEPTAVNGEGFGIEPFRPQRKMFEVSKKMFIPSETLEAMRAARMGATAAAAASTDGEAESASASGRVGSVAHARVKAPLRPWTAEELEAAKADYPPVRPVQDSLARFMSSTYARIQSKAGRTLELEPGAAWRAAMEAATQVGSSAVLLADRPADVTEHRMGAGLAKDSGVRLAASLALLIGGLVAELGGAFASLPDQAEAGAVAAAVAAAVAVAAPVVGPFLEVSRFADMSADQIEDAVAINEPISGGDLSKPLKLYGEDALLDWPGAFPALISERDSFMAKALAAVATGKAPVVPLYVLDDVDGSAVWRYAMPEAGPARAAPPGFGDGGVGPLAGVRAVVGVIGSAHVRGMVRDWQAAVKDTTVEPLLADAE
ncbi:hypothetical protein CHLRE_12g492350v5 [Chlamydomonas reinhardtii]|uniref:Uncharacterized protein n=1 Tax=Chlamydomonas reinhardtii TaxID=3055 RepID=A0A2K3D1X5_CHLRE|nr:uncharacterized protein CHLRE_12g492350v5 [Chlamydomonas reinhardtii]PNW74532.1 hypothetical protein CHLRE_12g492350v5 [Chlamydomonas reinhardtii]